MKYIRLYEERLKDFEIMTNPDHQMLIEELRKEIEKEDYDLGYIRDLVFYGHFDIDVFWKDEMGDELSFLMLASKLDKGDIVRVLLDEGSDPNLQNSYGSTALMKASERGDSQMVEEILKHPNIDPNLKNQYGYTALMIASYWGYSHVVQEILKYPSTDPNLKNEDGYTALHLASYWGHSQAVEELLKHPNINKFSKNRAGRTPWDVANSDGSQSHNIRREFPELKPEVR